jgi:hypothetical protein
LRLNDFTKATEESQTGLRYQTVLHELLHVVTLAQLDSYSAKSPAVKELASLFKTVRARMKKDLRDGSKHPAIVKMRTQTSHKILMSLLRGALQMVTCRTTSPLSR